MNSILTAVKTNIAKVIIGKEKEIDLLLAAFIAEGHVLLEDVPGTGKTLLAKALAQSFELDFKRLQFTPDLLPSDVTGLHYYNPQDSDFRFRPGPVFTNILLADEINRTSPRTQSSLLECMEEKQVTIDGTTFMLEPPFLVIATQNPVETLGTFPLPEAQLDRFLLKLELGLPDIDEERLIMERYLTDNPLLTMTPTAGKRDFLAAQEAYKKIYIHPLLQDYIARLVHETRRGKDVLLGVSPRGTLALLRVVRAYALIKGRDYVVPEDIKTLAVPVFSHRILFKNQAAYGRQAKSFISEILANLPLPTEAWEKSV